MVLVVEGMVDGLVGGGKGFDDVLETGLSALVGGSKNENGACQRFGSGFIRVIFTIRASRALHTMPSSGLPGLHLRTLRFFQVTIRPNFTASPRLSHPYSPRPSR